MQLYICMYILFYILFHYSLSWDSEYSSLCYTVGPCCFSVSSYSLLFPLLQSTRDNQVAGWVRVFGSDHQFQTLGELGALL